MKKASLRSSVLLSICTVIVFDLVLCQVFNIVSATSKNYRIKSEIFHHGLASNVDVIENWDQGSYRLITNSLGFKDRFQRDVTMKAPNKRILFIGDSFTEGIGVPFEKTFVGIIETQLQQHQVEVLNAGVVSYSPKIFLQKMAYLLSEGFEFDAVICLMDLSDIEDEMLYEMDQESRAHFVKDQTPLLTKVKMNLTKYSLIFKILYQVRKWAYNKPMIDVKRDKWPIDDALYQQVQPGIALAEKHMDQLYALLSSHHIKLCVVVYPYPDQILYGDWNSRYIALWRTWAQKKDVELINLFPQFQDKGSFDRVYTTYFIRNDVHWNANGHALIAPLILDKILRLIN